MSPRNTVEVLITDNTFDIGTSRLPEQTITHREYQELGGVPVKAQMEPIIDPRCVSGAVSGPDGRFVFNAESMVSRSRNGSLIT